MKGSIYETEDGQTVLEISDGRRLDVANSDHTQQITKLHFCSPISRLRDLLLTNGDTLKMTFPGVKELTVHATVFDDEAIKGDGELDQVDLAILGTLSESQLTNVGIHLPTSSLFSAYKSEKSLIDFMGAIMKQQPSARYTMMGTPLSIFPLVELAADPDKAPPQSLYETKCPINFIFEEASKVDMTKSAEIMLSLHDWISCEVPRTGGTEMLITGLEKLGFGEEVMKSDYDESIEEKESWPYWESWHYYEAWLEFASNHKGKLWEKVLGEAATFGNETPQSCVVVPIELNFKAGATGDGSQCVDCQQWNRAKEEEEEASTEE